jgi:hypothetical protein
MAVVKSPAPVNVKLFLPGTEILHPTWIEWFNNIDTVTGGVAGLGDLATQDVADIDGPGLAVDGNNDLEVDINGLNTTTANYLDEVMFSDVSNSNTLGKAKIEDFMLKAGGVLQIATTSSTTHPDITTVIPADDTIPQKTEGDEILSLSFTPRSSSSSMLLIAHTFGALYASGAGCTMALFKDAAADAIAATHVAGADATAQNLTLFHVESSTATSAITFAVRAGPASGSLQLLQTTGGTDFGGGVAFSSLWIVEYEGLFT